MFSVKDEWDGFKQKVLSDDSPEHQIKSMQLAFYAGVFSAMNMMREAGGHVKSEDEGIEILESIYNEATQYFNDFSGE